MHPSVVFLLVFFVVFVVVMATMPGPKLVLPKRKPRPEVDPWATWKETKATLDKARVKEHEEWQSDFNRIVQATCEHSYPATSQNPTYFTCWKCEQEEPWEYHEGCTCIYDTMTTLTSPFPEYLVTHRSGNCKWHGVDWDNYRKRSDRSNKPFKSALASR